MISLGQGRVRALQFADWITKRAQERLAGSQTAADFRVSRLARRKR